MLKIPRIACWAVLILALFPAVSAAHEIPNDVTIHVYLKPEGGRMHLLVRVPIKALRDVDFPKRGAGLLDLAQADPDLRDARDTAQRSEHGDISRVRRGGCWADEGWPCRSAFRVRFEPERRYDHIGFRVVIVEL